MSLIKSAFRYLSIFQKYLGARVYAVFALSILAAVTEGFAITLLLPLLAVLDTGFSGGADTGADAGDVKGYLANVLEELLTVLGIGNSVPGILLFIGLIFFIKGLIKFVEGAYKTRLEADLMCEVRGRLIDAYRTMDYRYYTRHSTGHFVNLVNEQVTSLVLAFAKYKVFMTALITVSAYFAFSLMLNRLLAVMSLVAGGLVLLMFRRLSRYVRALSRRTAEETGALSHLLVQTIQAFKYITATAQVGPLRSVVLQSVRRLASYYRRRGIASAFTDALREPLAVGVLVTIIVVQIAILDQPIAPILVAVLLIYRAMGQVVTLQASWQALMGQVGSLEVVEREFERIAQNQQVTGSVVLAPLRDRIELEGVCFAYSPADGNVLKNVTVSIPANRSVAFVGESGAGKSTLLDILTLMLRPQSGSLRIDGVPHEEIDVDSWRKQIGFVSQETVVFDDTIANNISLWAGDFDSDIEVRRGVEAAAARAHAREFIDELPDGFNTRVGDRGVRLSGGQRQRLFIARELYKNPRLLILDEATSALDSETESIIKTSIDQLRGETTVVIIAHRLSTIRNADHIYVMDRGRIIEEGRYEQLVDTEEGAFSRMVRLQAL